MGGGAENIQLAQLGGSTRQTRFLVGTGSIKGLRLAFGEYDAIGIVEMPDNASAAAFSLAAAAGGGVKAFKTTPLMTVEEGIEAMTKAGSCGYESPS